jgi:DNA-binding transcriptional regulator YiaG
MPLSASRNATGLDTVAVGFIIWHMAPRDAVRLSRIRRLAESGAARAIRESAGLSLTEAAEGAGVHRITVHRWERGSRRPRGDAALRYLDLLEQLS